jgi:hypothetical protein
MQSQINPRSGWVPVLLADPSDCFERAVEIVERRCILGFLFRGLRLNTRLNTLFIWTVMIA